MKSLAFISLLLALFHAYLIANSVDGRVPMQFDFQGKPTWSLDSNDFFIWQVCFLGFMNFILIGIAFGARHMSMDIVNIPFKSFWTQTKEREEECLRRLASALCGTAIFVNLIGFLVQELVGTRAGSQAQWLPTCK